MIEAGKLDRRIEIEALTETPNDYGEPERAWALSVTVWAQVTPVKSDERFTSDATRAAKLSRFRIRYRTGLAQTMRIKYNNQYYKILGIDELGRREGFDITAEAVEASGWN